MDRTLVGKEEAVRHLSVLIVIWVRLAIYGSNQLSTHIEPGYSVGENTRLLVALCAQSIVESMRWSVVVQDCKLPRSIRIFGRFNVHFILARVSIPL